MADSDEAVEAAEAVVDSKAETGAAEAVADSVAETAVVLRCISQSYQHRQSSSRTSEHCRNRFHRLEQYQSSSQFDNRRHTAVGSVTVD